MTTYAHASPEDRFVEECAICGDPVQTSTRTGWARRVSGWEAVRKQGGANKITNRRTMGEVAHVGCLDPKVMNGQQALTYGGDVEGEA